MRTPTKIPARPKMAAVHLLSALAAIRCLPLSPLAMTVCWLGNALFAAGDLLGWEYVREE